MNIVHILLVGAGGFLGSIARYLTVNSIGKRAETAFPYGTFVVNLVGSFILGAVLAILLKKTGGGAHEWKLFLGTGFCGGFTTFSAFAVENVNLFEQKLPGVALLYMSLSLIGGLLAVWSGFAAGRSLF